MTSQQQPSPAKKQPKQARAKATYEAVLDGAIRVLDHEGPDAATTSHIAEVAGVSVGTLVSHLPGAGGR